MLTSAAHVRITFDQIDQLPGLPQCDPARTGWRRANS
jgi:hypothetical protein